MAQRADALSIDAVQEPSDVKKVVKRVKLKRGVTVDSGAANNVMPKRMFRNKRGIRPSPGSLRRAHYVAANGGRIPNEGEANFKFKTTKGQAKDWVFQVAEVTKALAAVSYLVDTGHRVIFDQDEKTGADISMMVEKKTGEVTRFRRERNVWVVDAIVEVDEDDEQHFHRRA